MVQLGQERMVHALTDVYLIEYAVALFFALLFRETCLLHELDRVKPSILVAPGQVDFAESANRQTLVNLVPTAVFARL